MRFHRHQVGRTNRWHSVRVRHEDVWNWCAHHDEIEWAQRERRRRSLSVSAGKQFKLQVAH